MGLWSFTVGLHHWDAEAANLRRPVLPSSCLGLRPRWAEAGLRLRRTEVPERSALLSDKIIR